MAESEHSRVEGRLERLEEALWVTEAQAGSTEAFVKLMGQYEKPVLYYLRRLVPEGDFALDLFQEVWVAVYRGLAGLERPEAFRAWVYRIAHRKAGRFIREEILQEGAAAAFAEELAEPGEGTGNGALNAEAVHRALGELPPRQREILVLHYLRELSTDELAAVLDCPAGTVKSRLYHARGALRWVMERKKL